MIRRCHCYDLILLWFVIGRRFRLASHLSADRTEQAVEALRGCDLPSQGRSVYSSL